MARIQGDGVTPQEDLFIEAYLSNGYNRKDAVVKAGYSTDKPSAQGGKLLQRVAVQKEIRKRIDKKRSSFFVQELDVLEGLYREANNTGKGSTQTGRISAWVNIGKHLGMFSEDKQVPGVGGGGAQINIINYNTTGEAIAKSAKAVEGVVTKRIEEIQADE